MQNKLENYETVKERKKRFYKDYPDGSLLSEIIHHEKGHVIMKGVVYKTKEDQKSNVPTGVGHAEEYQGQGGFANKYSWMENCCESSIGRALDNAGYAGNNKCSKEEMDKVKRNEKADEKKPSKEEIIKKIKYLPKDIQEYFQLLAMTDADKYEFCKEKEWDILKMKQAISAEGCEKFEDIPKFDL